MERLAEAEVVAGEGIADDRYATKKGTYSVLRVATKRPGEREPGRQITLVSADSVDKALRDKGIEPLASVGSLRRNIVLRGITAAELLDSIGSELALGPEVVVFVHRHCVPCMYNERKNCRPGLMEAVWEAAGVSCEVVLGGTLREGAEVSHVPRSHAPERVDAGSQFDGYYLPPSRRSDAHFRDAVREKKKAAALAHRLRDSEGLQRAEAAYRTVGLGFWPTSVVVAAPASRWRSWAKLCVQPLLLLLGLAWLRWGE